MLAGLASDQEKGAEFYEKAVGTKTRVMRFAHSASNIATQIEKNVNMADQAMRTSSQLPSDFDMSEGIDSDGEIMGRDAIRRPYFWTLLSQIAEF